MSGTLGLGGSTVLPSVGRNVAGAKNREHEGFLSKCFKLMQTLHFSHLSR